MGAKVATFEQCYNAEKRRRLRNNYLTITPQEADYEVSVIKRQSEIVLDLLDHMIEALQIEADESEKKLKAGKEVCHE